MSGVTRDVFTVESVEVIHGPVRSGEPPAGASVDQ